MDVVKFTKKVLTPPEVTIKGIPVTLGAPIVWNLMGGGNPSIAIISIDDASASEIWDTSGPFKKIDIKAKYQIGGNDDIDEVEFLFDNLYISERRYIDPYYTQFIVMDTRMKLLNQLVSGCYNYRLQDPAIQFIISPGAVGKLPFEDYWFFQAQSYLNWSVKSDGSPYNAIEILDLFLREGLGADFGGWIGSTNKVTAVGDWSDAAPDFLTFNEVPLAQAIDKLSALTRTAICNHLDGKIYAHKLIDKKDPKPPNLDEIIPDIQWRADDSQLIYKRYMAQLCPAKWRCYFKKLIGVPLIYEYDPDLALYTPEEIIQDLYKIKKGTEGIPMSKPCVSVSAGKVGLLKAEPSSVTPSSEKRIGVVDVSENIPEEIWGQNNLINVAQTPYTMTLDVDGIERVFPRGSWVPILVLMNQVGVDPNGLLNEWYESVWKTDYWSKNLVTDTFESLASARKYDERKKAILQSIDRSWWRTFMIKPNLRRMFTQFMPNDVAMVDWTTNYLQPSPIWCNYIDSPTMQQLADANAQGEEVNLAMSNVNEEIHDKTIEEILNMAPTPFYIKTIDAGLGIIEASEMKDYHNVHYCFEPGTLDTIPSTSPELGYVNLTECKKVPEFKFATVMSANPLIPNSIDRNFCISINSENKGANIDGDVYCDMEVARYGWQEEQKSPSGEPLEGTGTPDVNAILDKPINLDQLEILAQTEVAIQEYRYMPWYVGEMTFNGLHPINPVSNLTITYQISDTYCSTKITASVPAPPQEAYALLPDKLRRAFKHELDRFTGKNIGDTP